MPAQPSPEGASKETRFPLQCAPEKEEIKSLLPPSGWKDLARSLFGWRAEKSPTLLLKVSAFKLLCVNTSGVDSWALIAKGQILLSVAPRMVL